MCAAGGWAAPPGGLSLLQAIIHNWTQRPLPIATP